LVFCGIDPYSLSFKSLQLQAEAVVVCLYAKLPAVIEAVVAAAVHRVSQVEFLYSVAGVGEGQAQGINISWFAELKASKAEILLSAGGRRIEEVNLVDIYLIVNPIDEVGTYRFLKVGE
jgi:hypothetical protein